MANGKGNFLYNPFTQNVISLPKQYVPWSDCRRRMLTWDRSSYFAKSILCCYPTPSSSLCVMALGASAHVIEMCRPHDSQWFVYGVSKEEEDEDNDDDDGNDDDDDDDDDDDNDDDYEDDNDDDDDDSHDDDLSNFSSEDERDNEPEVVKDEEQIIEEENEENKGLFADVLFYKGILYGLTRASTLITFELSEDSSNPLAYKVLNMTPIYIPRTRGVTCYKYLVESCGELLMIHRYRNVVNNGDVMKYFTMKFIVYKLHQSSDSFQWVQVQSLGDQMVFLGRHSSVSISATCALGVKGNCIYFTEDYWPYWWLGINSKASLSDNGVFYLDDGRIESYYTPDDAHHIKCQPFWITPNSIHCPPK